MTSIQENRTTGQPVGRPSKFTAETRNKLLAVVRAGNFITVACRHAGIGERTFYDWRAYAMRLIEIIDNADDPDAEEAALIPTEREFVSWWRELQMAEDDAEVRLVTQWASASSHDWRAARDLLSRRHPDRWKEQTGTQISGPGGGPIVMTSLPAPEPDADHLAKVVSALRDLGHLPEATDGG